MKIYIVWDQWMDNSGYSHEKMITFFLEEEKAVRYCEKEEWMWYEIEYEGRKHEEARL